MVVDADRSIVEVAVLNISPQGAELLIGEGTDVPGCFVLFVDAEKVSLDCRLRWRNGKRVGVEVLRPCPLPEWFHV